MTGDSPSWIGLDLQAGPVSPALQLPSEVGGEGPTTVMIMATGAAREEGWAARATLHLVREWTRAGARILLMDLDLDAPDLHGLLGHENREGASDVILYGASIPRVSRPADEGSFYLATAGTAVADATEVLSHSRWTEVIQGFREAGVTPVLYCPQELLAPSPLTRAAKVRILLRGPGDGDVVVDPKGPTPTVVAGPGSGASGGAESTTPESLSPESQGDPEEGGPTPAEALDLDVATPGAQREVGPEEADTALHGEETQSMDLGTPQGLDEPDAPAEPSAQSDPDASGAPGAPADLDALEVAHPLRDRLPPEDPSPSEGPNPPAPAPAAPVTSGKPREVAGTGGGSAVLTALLVILVLLVGVLLADYLGFLDLSSLVDLPWHDTATAAAHSLGRSTE